MEDVKNSMFTEALIKKGYEIVYLTEPVDEYTIQGNFQLDNSQTACFLKLKNMNNQLIFFILALPEFDGKRFQNVAKEGVDVTHNANYKEKMDAEYEDLTKWFKDHALMDKIEKAEVSMILDSSPAALIASQYGWSANMQRIMEAQAYQTGNDASQAYYKNQKKTLGINPRHPLIKVKLKEKSY